jgi:hypothetical protein
VTRYGSLDLVVKSDFKNDVLLVVHSIRRLSYFAYFVMGFISWLFFLCSMVHIILGCNFMVEMVYLV